MPKRATRKTIPDAPNALQVTEASGFSTVTCCRYLAVLERHGDVIEIAPRNGHQLSLVHRVDANGRRVLRLLVAVEGQPTCSIKRPITYRLRKDADQG
jgi:hypothetical protein